MKLRTIALRNIRRNLRRSLLSLVAIGVAAAGISMLYSLLAGMMADLEQNLATYYTGEVRVRHREYDRYEMLNPLHLRVAPIDEVMAVIEADRRVDRAVPRLSFPAGVYTEEDTYGALVIGGDPTREEAFQDFSRSLVDGVAPQAGENQAAVGALLARELGVVVGDKITLLATTMRRGTNAVTVRITGLLSFPVMNLNKTAIVIPIETARRLARMDDAATEVVMKLHRGARPREVASALNARFGELGRTEIEAKSWEDIPTTYAYMGTAQLIYDIFALVFFILASAVIVTTTMMVIYERMREIGTVGALGMTGSQIVSLFFLEALYLGLIGALAGTMVGTGATYVLSVVGLDFSAAMEGVDFEIGGVIYPRITLKSTLIVFLYATAVAALASLIPARRAARIKPVEALRAT